MSQELITMLIDRSIVCGHHRWQIRPPAVQVNLCERDLKARTDLLVPVRANVGKYLGEPVGIHVGKYLVLYLSGSVLENLPINANGHESGKICPITT